jgi:hypothetical protein
MVTSSAKATYANRVRVGKALNEDDPKPEYPNVLNKLREKAEHVSWTIKNIIISSKVVVLRCIIAWEKNFETLKKNLTVTRCFFNVNTSRY